MPPPTSPFLPRVLTKPKLLRIWIAHPPCGTMLSRGWRSSELICSSPRAACAALCLWDDVLFGPLDQKKSSLLIPRLSPASARFPCAAAGTRGGPVGRRCRSRRRFLSRSSPFATAPGEKLRTCSSSSAALPSHCVLLLASATALRCTPYG
jgi:hypothetical protein